MTPVQLLHRVTILLCSIAPFPQLAADRGKLIALDDPARLVLRDVNVAKVTHEGRTALQVLDPAPEAPHGGEQLALIPDVEFGDGVIELDVASEVLPTAPPDARGFVGLAFHVVEEGRRFECFYLRPTNGRADDQVRRNHSVQYISHPEYPWHRLRKESPEKYESYADVIPKQWIHVKLEVKGDKARFYVNGAEQPTLIVNDLKRGAGKGKLALWIGGGTDAYFSKLRVSAD
jgi:hypothetical protein